MEDLVLCLETPSVSGTAVTYRAPFEPVFFTETATTATLIGQTVNGRPASTINTRKNQC